MMTEQEAGFDLGTTLPLAVATTDPVVLTAAARCGESNARMVVSNLSEGGFMPLLHAADNLLLKADRVLGWPYRTSDLPAPLPGLLSPSSIFASPLTDVADPVLVTEDPSRPVGNIVVRAMTPAEVASMRGPRPQSSRSPIVFDAAFAPRLAGVRTLEQFEAIAHGVGTLEEIHPEQPEHPVTYVWLSRFPSDTSMRVTFHNALAVGTDLYVGDGKRILLDGNGAPVKASPHPRPGRDG